MICLIFVVALVAAEEFRALLDAAELPPSHRRDERSRHVAYDQALRDRFGFQLSHALELGSCRLLPTTTTGTDGVRLEVLVDLRLWRRDESEKNSNFVAASTSCAVLASVSSYGNDSVDANLVTCRNAKRSDSIVKFRVAASRDVVLAAVAALELAGVANVNAIDDALMMRVECADPSEWFIVNADVDDARELIRLELSLVRAVALLREEVQVLGAISDNGARPTRFSASLTRHRLNDDPMTPFRLSSWSTNAGDQSDDDAKRVRSSHEHATGTVKVLGFNVWNFDDGPEWPERVRLIAQIINETSPDIIALQEVRIKLNNPNAKSQLADIVALLDSTYAHFAYQGAMVHPQTYDEEGLGLISRYPLEHDWASLPAAEADLNQRIVLSTVSVIDGVPIVLANAHWTYDEASQLDQAYATVGNVKGRTPHSGAGRIITGDFNLYVHAKPSPTEQFMEGRLQYLGSTGDYVDAWKARAGAGDKELMTFSPVKGWTARPDRFYVDRTRCGTKSFSLVGIKATRGRFPSDHAGILGVFECKKR